MFFMAVVGVFVNVLLLFVLGGAHGHGEGGGGHSHGSRGGGHSHSHSHSHSHGGAAAAARQRGDESHDDHSHDDDEGEEEATPLITASSSSRRRRGQAAATPAQPAAASLNLRGAWLHAAGDLLQSVGVAVAGAVVFFKPSWTLADPLVTLLFAVLVFATTKGIAGELLSILMEAAPARVDLEALERELLAVPGVASLGDLHIWGLSSGIALGTAHLNVVPGCYREVLAAARRAMEAHGVAHSTIQIEEIEGDEGGA